MSTTRRAFIISATAIALAPHRSLAQAMMKQNSYSQQGDLTFDPMPVSWYNNTNKIQIGEGAQADIYLPPVASAINAPIQFGIYPMGDGALTRLIPAGNDSICGNHGEWWMRQDENMWFTSDWPLMTASSLGSGDSSNWSIQNSRPRIRQCCIGQPLTTQPMIYPTYENWEPIPGFSCALRFPLQSGSSRTRIKCSVSISSTAPLDRIALTLCGSQFGMVTPLSGPGSEGLVSQRTPYTSDSMQFDFSWSLPAGFGYIPDMTSPVTGKSMNLLPETWQLMVKNSDTTGTMVVNPAQTVSFMDIEEYSVA